MRREGVIKLAVKLQSCVIAMEACCGAHHLGRVLRAQGHEVRLMSPEYVRPYVKSQKNDDRDAEAIAEAATRPTMRFVALKSEEQLDMQTLHRARDRLVGERTALINQLRAVLLERGITVAQGRRKLERHLAGLNGPEGLSQRMRVLIEDMRLQWSELDRRIAELDKELAEWVRNEEAARRLMTIPGIGVLNATALIAAIGQGESFARGRDLAVARLGAAAGNNRRQTASGRNQQAGQQVFRKLLIHGARAALPTLLESPTPLGAWLRGLMTRMHKNAAVVALANKLARMAWAVLRHNETFRFAVSATT
jgi:transposase